MNYGVSTRLLAQSTLRTILGTKNLTELLTEREAIARQMKEAIDSATHPWGVKVERVEMSATEFNSIGFIYKTSNSQAFFISKQKRG